MITMRLHTIFILLDIRQRKKVVQEHLRSKTIVIEGEEIVGTSLIQMLLSNFAKFVQVQLRPMSLNSVLGKNHKITVEQLMLPFFFEEFETFIRAV
jgi:hypothetical protein